MALSYEFSIGSVRAKECSLFSQADFEQMLLMKNEADLIRFLKDKGYGEGDTTEDILESNEKKTWEYLRGVAPDIEIFNVFLLQNDIHNFKTILKGTIFEKDYRKLLLDPYTIDPDVIRKAVENRKFDKLPEWLADAARESYDILAHSSDARLSDGIADKALMEHLISKGKASGSGFLREYFETMAFYADIKIAIRAARTKASRDYLDAVLCRVEGLDCRALAAKAVSGYDNLLKYAESIRAYDCRTAIGFYRSSPPALERFVDNKLISLAKKYCRYTTEGAEPLFGYYLGCECERKIIYIISGGINTRTSPDKIRERLREYYG